jgi:anti-sigma B factor antagonist
LSEILQEAASDTNGERLSWVAYNWAISVIKATMENKMLLNIQKRRVGAEVIVLGLAGRITLGGECQEVEWQVEDLLKEHERKIIFDFSELKYLDSTGVGALVMCSGKVKQAGGELSVVGAHGIVEQTLKMTRVDQIVTLYATVEAAAEHLTTVPSLNQPARRSESKGGDLVRLHAETRRIGDVALVTCSGRIVAGPQLEPLRDQIKSLLPESRDIALHLGEVTFIDSSGLGMLVRLLASARAAGGDIKLCNVPREIHHTLRITNLITLFDTHETQLEAISSLYQHTTSSTRVTPSEVRILCIDRSTDVLAYLRELLLHAGYNPLTNNSIYDALILLKAARPKLVILGPNPPSEHPTETWETFRKAAMCLPLVELENDFSSREAGQAGAQLLGTVRALLSPKSGAEVHP